MWPSVNQSLSLRDGVLLPARCVQIHGAGEGKGYMETRGEMVLPRSTGMLFPKRGEGMNGNDRFPLQVDTGVGRGEWFMCVLHAKMLQMRKYNVEGRYKTLEDLFAVQCDRLMVKLE